MRTLELPIESLHAGVLETPTDAAGDSHRRDDQNVQARLRGLLAMALANERNAPHWPPETNRNSRWDTRRSTAT